MARPKKEYLDYFPFDVTFFGDRKIKRIKAQCGTDGICVYLYILCEAYRNGYYAVYDKDLVLDISDYFNFSEAKTKQIISCLLSRSLLQCIPVKSVKVLTAESVQLRYQAAKKGARRDIYVDERIWLIPPEKSEPFIKMRTYENKSGKNMGYSGKNDNKPGKNPTKESKVKKSKEKERKVCTGFDIPCKNGTFTIDEELLSELTHTYPDMKVEDSFNKLRNYLSANPHKLPFVSSAPGYIRMWLAEDDRAGKYRKNSGNGHTATYDLSEYEQSSILDYFTEDDQ